MRCLRCGVVLLCGLLAVLLCAGMTMAAAADAPPDISQFTPTAPAPGDPFYDGAGVMTLENSAADASALTFAPTASEVANSDIAYENDSSSAAAVVLRQKFASQLATSAYGVERATGTFKRFDNGHQALFLVRGRPQLMTSTLPLATGHGSAMQPVSLMLDDTSKGFVPENPAVGMRIASASSGSAVLTGLGIGLRALVHSVPGSVLSGDDQSVFYGNVATDTDELQTATPDGVELLTQLRSVRSPLTQRYELSLPAGDRAVAADGGVRIETATKTVAMIGARRRSTPPGNPFPCR